MSDLPTGYEFDAEPTHEREDTRGGADQREAEPGGVENVRPWSVEREKRR